MATQVRQSNLFAAEDWKSVYEAFRKIDLQSYDFDTIREAMINHLRTTYPDNFNDWIGNQEFIFILDTLCFMGQNLAFRMDLNTRENFIDTAERRESVLRLAQMLAYSPRRNYPSRGLVKLTSITTTLDVRDSNGSSLAGKEIKWNDPLNPDWYEQFILVMNANLLTSNPFGQPVKRYVEEAIQTHLYGMNTIAFSSVAEQFSATVNGESMNFEIINPDIDNVGTIVERHPEPQERKYIVYRNDGNGFASPNTGFFMMFKQGSLKFEDHLFETSIENRVVNIDVPNINELDVWVQQITDDGVVSNKWTKVLNTQNIMYNSVSKQITKIFSVVTRDEDKISIRFPDSTSGDVPRGTYRIWYRVSNGLGYTVRTTDIQNKSVNLRVRGHNQTDSEESTLTVKFSLEYEVRNAQPQETIEQIRVRAPQTYYTSNRLISGEDYNIGPLRSGNLVKKAKSINRTYSGHSRFIDINDPTGRYQNTNVFGDDGSIYQEFTTKQAREELPSSRSNSAIVRKVLQPLLSYNSLQQLYTHKNGSAGSFVEATNSWIWDQTDTGGNLFELSSEYDFDKETPMWIPKNNQTTYGTLTNMNGIDDIHSGMLIKFLNESGTDFIWASVLKYTPNQYSEVESGGIILDKPVPTGYTVYQYYKNLSSEFTYEEINKIRNLMDLKSTFGLGYNPVLREWYTITDGVELNKPTSTSRVLILVEYTSQSWVFSARGISFIFTGGDNVSFFFVNEDRLSDVSSGTAKSDTITVLKSNFNAELGYGAYAKDIPFVITDNTKQSDGRVNPYQVVLKASGSGRLTDPTFYKSLVPSDDTADIIVWSIEDNIESVMELPTSEFFIYDPETLVIDDVYQRNINILTYPTVGTVFYYKPNDTFYQYKTDGKNLTINATGEPIESTDVIKELNQSIMSKHSTDPDLVVEYMNSCGFDDVSTRYKARYGRKGLYFQWKHYAPEDHRIDPAITNIHDMFVLTTEYYELVKKWAKTVNPGEIPKPPTTAELTESFKEIEQIKAVSDSMIWNSGRFVPIFGSNADPEHQATFKIVRVNGSRYSDDELRQKVISIIDEYFDIENWDFGDTFYFTELSTYIHQQLATDISSVVIVPKSNTKRFGTLFQITPETFELFISTAKVSDVEIINSLTSSNMRIGL